MDMDSKNDFETVIIEGEVWAVTSPPGVAEDNAELETDSTQGVDSTEGAAAMQNEGESTRRRYGSGE